LTPEQKVQRAVCRYAVSLGFLPKRNFMGPGVQTGWPDTEIFMPGGRLLLVEFKAPPTKKKPKKKQPTKIQQWRIDQVLALGFDVIVCDDIEAGKSVLNEYALGNR